MPMFEISCPYCQAKLQVQDEWCGMTVKCPFCTNDFPVEKTACGSQVISSDQIVASNTKDNPIWWVLTLFCPCFFILSKNKARAWTARILTFIFFIIVVGSNNKSESISSANSSENIEKVETSMETKRSSYAEKFSGDCGISASGNMSSDIIGQPKLTVDIFNKSNKTVEAVKFYFIPLDVYGKECEGFWVQNRLYTDSAIRPEEADSASWQFLEDSVKTGKLFIYSVYFSDGTEWGDKDASSSSAQKYGKRIKVSGKSR